MAMTSEPNAAQPRLPPRKTPKADQPPCGQTVEMPALRFLTRSAESRARPRKAELRYCENYAYRYGIMIEPHSRRPAQMRGVRLRSYLLCAQVFLADRTHFETHHERMRRYFAAT